MKRFLFLLVLAPFLFGCAKSPIEVNNFELAPGQPKVRNISKNGNNLYIRYNNDKFAVEAGVFEYNGIVVVPLDITNKEKKNIPPQDYSISLYDGRDFKEIKMLTRQDIILTKGRYQGSPPSLGISNQLIETTFQTISNIVSPPTKNQLLQTLNYAIDNYFSFRPIYAGETRKGIICFLVDFKLEYPLTLLVEVDKEKHFIYFWPQPKPIPQATPQT
ncbi:MAG: hypothetical protein PHH14_03990 [Candidatus Margulisbacteria bacterium]|nr:hypothetical protein [Candidatus Margulisiibacteriota bacterium]